MFDGGDAVTDLPLTGVRIVDFTWMGVGPTCTLLCSWMGAECIKIETASRPMYNRGAQRKAPDPKSGAPADSLNQLNVNKLSACINLKHSEGVDLVKALVGISHVVAENFQAGVMDRLGLGYKELAKVNPAIIMLSMSAHGAFGPETEGKGLAAVFGALGGAGHISGYEDGPPVETRLSADLVSGTTACFALLTALYHARKTGEGTWIDFSSREVMSSFVGEALLDAMVNGRDQPRLGNRHPSMAPHDVFPCAEPGGWVSVAVSDQSEWEALCKVTGSEEWLKDDRYGDGYLRWKNQDEFDGKLREWTTRHTSKDAMNILQKAGVPATACFNARDLLEDPHLRDRRVFQKATDEDGVPKIIMGLPWQSSRTVPTAPTRPPDVGEHNNYVFMELLGMGESEVQELVDREVIM